MCVRNGREELGVLAKIDKDISVDACSLPKSHLPIDTRSRIHIHTNI
jgi:hypothetical protein